tara:strand:- start:224 stop:766 length:543 start_codon:yes stop_codon:yes gene_type:complete
MTTEQFWIIIEEAWQNSENATQAYFALKTILSKTNTAELVSFAKHFSKYEIQLLTPEHLSAAFLLCEGWLSEGEFQAYAWSVVAVPRKVFEDVVRNPDSILIHKEFNHMPGGELQPFGTVVFQVAEERKETLPDFKVERVFNLKSIQFGGKSGKNILDQVSCAVLTPKIYEKLSENVEWD